jgi:hypothetical protein
LRTPSLLFGDAGHARIGVGFGDYGFRVLNVLPCASPSSGDWSGGVGEDCLSAQREFRSRLTSRATQGTHEVGGKPGATSFGYFSWQDKKSNLLSGNPRRC